MPDRIGSSIPSPTVPSTTPTQSQTPANAVVPATSQPTPATGWTAVTGGATAPTSDGFQTQSPAQAKAAATTATAAAAKDDGGGLIDGIKDKLVTTLWDQASQERDLNLANVKLGKNDTFGIRAYENAVAPDDDSIAKDPQRSQYEKAHPDLHVWMKTGGVASDNLGLSVPFVAGPASGSVGFNASTSLDYAMLSPYAAKPGSALQLPKNMTIDLPVNAKNASKMAQGAEFTIKGDGSVGGSVSVNAGDNLKAGPLDVGISAGINSSANVSGEIQVNVKKLDGDKVYVKLSRTSDISQSTGASVKVGASLDDNAVNSVTKHLPKNALLDLATGKATDAVKSKVEDYLQVQASMSKGRARDTQNIGAFVLDLSKPGAAKAYDSLMHLDTGPATQLAKTPNAGVSAAKYEETKTSTTGHAELTAGPAKLFLMDSLKQYRSGTLTSNQGTLAFKQSLFQKSSSHLFGGQRSVGWEGMTYAKNGADPQTYFHLTFDRKDGSTRDKDIAQFQRFAGDVGAQMNGPGKEEAGGNLISRIFNGKYGRAEEKLDMYVTRDGLQKLQNVNGEQVIAAYAQAAQRLEGSAKPPAWSVPATQNDAVAMMQRYAQTDPNKSDQRLQISASYNDKYGRNIMDDIDDLKSAQTLAQHVDSMKGQPDSEWIKAFSDLGSKEQFGFWKDMSTLSSLVGKDQTLVHQMSLKGDRVEITAQDKGMIPGVDDTIGATLAPP